MKLLLAMMSHETNTFSPVPTKLARFGDGKAPLEGEAALTAFRSQGAPLSGMINAAETAGHEINLAIAANAPPSGPVIRETFDYICDTILAGIGAADAVMLDLHGAMVAQHYDDGEGTLLGKIRKLNPTIPIGVSLDMHANLYPEIVENATIVSGFHYYPHTDMYDTGKRTAEMLLDCLSGKYTPAMVWGNKPMLPHVMRQGTDDMPNKEIQARVMEMERNGEALLASVFTGFPHADIKNAGLSAVVVTDADEAKAIELRDELLDMAWQARRAFVYVKEDLATSVSKAKQAATEGGDGPVILLDHYDNTASGGTMDTTEVLKEILQQELDDVAVFGFYDPEAVQQMLKAGIGGHVNVSLGGKQAMPALAKQSAPLAVKGKVLNITNGEYTVTGPMSTGSHMKMGDTVVLELDLQPKRNVQVVVVSQHVEPFDMGCFKSLGINPLKKTFIMLKSRIHYRASFLPIAKKIVECAGCGVCTSEYDQLTFDKVRRPIFPLDNI